MLYFLLIVLTGDGLRNRDGSQECILSTELNNKWNGCAIILKQYVIWAVL